MKAFKIDGRKLSIMHNSIHHKKKEKTLQNLIENNLDIVFPNLIFIDTEFPAGKFRFDTLAYNKHDKSFVILEYKITATAGVLEQAKKYLEIFHKQRLKIVLKYNKKMNEFNEESDFNWKKTQIKVIAPSFTKYQSYTDKNVFLYEINQFGDFLTLKNMNDDDEYNDQKISVPDKNSLPPKSENDYLNSVGASTQSQNLYAYAKSMLKHRFSDLEFKVLKKSINFYLSGNKTAIGSFVVRKHNIDVYYNPKNTAFPNNDFVHDISNIGSWGVGNYRSKVHTESDFNKALEFIQIVYDERRK